MVWNVNLICPFSKHKSAAQEQIGMICYSMVSEYKGKSGTFRSVENIFEHPFWTLEVMSYLILHDGVWARQLCALASEDLHQSARIVSLFQICILTELLFHSAWPVLFVFVLLIHFCTPWSHVCIIALMHGITCLDSTQKKSASQKYLNTHGINKPMSFLLIINHNNTFNTITISS